MPSSSSTLIVRPPLMKIVTNAITIVVHTMTSLSGHRHRRQVQSQHTISTSQLEHTANRRGEILAPCCLAYLLPFWSGKMLAQAYATAPRSPEKNTMCLVERGMRLGRRFFSRALFSRYQFTHDSRGYTCMAREMIISTRVHRMRET